MIPVPIRTIRSCPDCGCATVWDRYICARCAAEQLTDDDIRAETDGYRRALRRVAGEAALIGEAA